MKENNVIDGNTTQDTVLQCGNTLIGTDSGPCPSCQKRKALMLSGLCGSCASKRGIHPFSTQADVMVCPDENKKE